MSADSSKSQRAPATTVKPVPRPQSKPVSFGAPIRVVLTVILVVLLSQFMAVLVAIGFLSLTNGQSNFGDIIEGSAANQLLFLALAQAIAIGLIYLFLRRRRLSFRNIGFGRRPKWSDLGIVALGFIAYYAVLIVTTLTLSYLIPSFDVDQAQDVGFNLLNSNTDRFFAFLALVIIAPVGEEILMRGYLYTGLRSKLRFLPALIITSLIFGLAHLEFGGDGPPVWVAGLATFILSVVLIYAREKSGALYASIAIHGLNNFVAFSIHFL